LSSRSIDATVPPIRTDRLELVSLAPSFLDALLGGSRAEAEAEGGFSLPDGWPDAHDRRFLELRLRELRDEPDRQQWLVRALVVPEQDRPMIGSAGFHGPPGRNAIEADDAVELGYAVLPPYRGRGYATEAVRALIHWASGEHGIRHFVASVAPDNAPSLAIVRRLGFEQTGRHWDDEDGEELEFELRIATGAP
jgi:ribosomal-protein-alanine N-acetyltransferase